MTQRAEQIAWGLALALVLVSGRAGAWGQERDKKLPKAEELIDKSIEACGGKAAMDKLNTRVVKISVDAGPQGKAKVTVYEARPNKRHTIVEMPAAKQESGFDGEVAWQISPMGAKILTGEQRATAIREATFNADLEWRKLYQKAETLGEAEIDGRPTWKVVFTPELGNPETVYYDQKTFLPVRKEVKIKAGPMELQIEATYDDYQKTDGVLLPHRVRQRIVQLDQTTEWVVEKVEHNVELPPDRFALPQQIKDLLEKQKADTQTKPSGA